MARVIARISGVALAPGVSLNRRLYTPEVIAGAVTRAQARIGGGGLPLTMLTHHGAEDDSTKIVGKITSMRVTEDGSAVFDADIVDTPEGRTIATLADSSDGEPFLRTTSMRGAWVGKVRRVTADDGKPAETADALDFEGVDFTKSPGVGAAQIRAFSWATDGQTETTERVLITESVQEAAVTFTEAAGETGQEGAPPAPPPAVLEAVRTVFAPAEVHILEDGLCATCGDVEEAKRKPNTKPYGDVPYADPGYLDANGKQASSSGKPGIKRYPLDKKHIRAAWSYINQARNAAQYTATQLKRIKSRIKAAMGSIGAKVAAESDIVAGFVIGEAVEATPEVLEWLGENPKRSGSWSVSASNGPVNLNLSSYCMDPADLNVILRAAADAACKALTSLDPDMDGDVDVPGASGSGSETAPDDDDPATESADPASAGDEGPAPAGTETESEDPAMPQESSTTETAGAAPAGLTLESIQKTASEAATASVAAYFEARDKAKAERKKAAKEAAEREAREAAARKTALTEALAELGIKVPGQAAETAPAAAGGGGGGEGGTGGNVTETTEQREARIVKEALTEFTQGLMAGGAILPSRAGLVVREHAIPDADSAPDGEALRGMSDDELMNHLGGALAQQADSIRPVGAG